DQARARIYVNMNSSTEQRYGKVGAPVHNSITTNRCFPKSLELEEAARGVTLGRQSISMRVVLGPFLRIPRRE
ncbi:MAG TPA: hypothetical protein VFI90_05965, partial [Rubrobacter sp.]|nr:hypothetical protein [Rubrobacter sp.]